MCPLVGMSEGVCMHAYSISVFVYMHMTLNQSGKKRINSAKSTDTKGGHIDHVKNCHTLNSDNAQ